MPNMLGGASLTTFGFQSMGPLAGYWVPPTQTQWERPLRIYDPNDDLTIGAFEYIEEPTRATDALIGQPFGPRGESQMQQLLAT